MSFEDLGPLEFKDVGPLHYRLPREDQINPLLRDTFTSMAKDFYEQTGEPLKVTSSFRSNEEQTDLYKRKPTLAAQPGKSRHEVGEALDIDSSQVPKLEELGLLDKHGFVRPVLHKGETWHIELPRFEKAEKIAATVSGFEDLGPVGGFEDMGPVESKVPTREEPVSSKSELQENLQGWNAKATPEFKQLKESIQDRETQDLRNEANIAAGPARETNLPGAVDWPLEQFLRKPLRYFHSKVIEPGRAETEKQMARFIQDPGVGTAAPEAFAPLPSEEVFVPVAELAAFPGITKAVSLLINKPISMLASKIPQTLFQGTTSALGDVSTLAARGAMENKVMDLLMKGRALPRPTPPYNSPALRSGLRYGEEFGALPEGYDTTAAARTATENIISRYGQEKTWADILFKQGLDKAKGTEGTPFKHTWPSTSMSEPLSNTPIANQELLRALGISEGTPTNQLLQAVLGGGDKPGSQIIDNIKKGFITGGAGATLSSLVTPDEAEARVNPTVMLEAIGEVVNIAKGTTGRELIETIANTASRRGVDAGKLGRMYKSLEASGGLEGLLQETVQVRPSSSFVSSTAVPKTIKDLGDELVGVRKPKRGQIDVPDELSATKIDPEVPSLPKDMNRIDLERSPNIVSSNYMGPENNLVVDYAEATKTFNNNMPTVSRVFDNIVKKFGFKKDIAASEKEVNDTMGPLFTAWRSVIKEEVRLEGLIKSERKYLAEFDPMSAEATATKEKIVTLEADLMQAKQTNAPIIADIYMQRQTLLEELGAKYTNVRIKSAAEGQEWAQALIQPNEVEAVKQTRKYLDQTKQRMTDLGMKTFESPTKEYVPYIYQTGEYGDTGKKYFAEKLWYGKKDKPNSEWLDFMSRQPGSGDWFPLWKQSMEAYIPSTERSLAFNPFLRKWTPAIHEWRVGDKPMAAEWASGFINRNMSSESTNIVMQGLNKLTNLEYFHYLAGSVSTAFLHLFKLTQTPIWHGFIPTLKAAGNMIKAAVSPESAERALYHNYVQARMLTRAVAQEPGMSTFLEPKWWKGMLDKGLNSPFINPTKMIEAFDNGMNMFASMHSGLAKGASAETINAAVLGSQMLVNFRGFSMPRMMTHPGTRALMMFQATPFKLAENKLDLIMKALTGKTDIYGRSDMNKLIRFITLTGLTVGTGKALGIDLGKHAGFHMPFTSETPSGETTLAVPPFMKYGATAAKQGVEAGAKEALSYWGPIQKVAEDFIPEKYSDSKIQQILGVPTKGWQQEGQAKKELAELRSLRQKRHDKSDKGKVDTPYEFLLGLMGGD